MSEKNENGPAEEAIGSPEARRKQLMARAGVMGLKVSPNIGLDALQAKINAALESEAKPTPDDGEDDEADSKVQIPGFEAPPAAATAVAAAPVFPAAPETASQKRARLTREAKRLVRVRIVCMNPNKKDLPGEIFSVSNRYIGTVKKFIPFVDQPDGYHIPHCLYEEMKNRKYLHIQTKANKRDPNTPMVSTRDMPEFAIELLTPLTQRELKALAQRQAMAAGTAPVEEQSPL